MLASKTRLYLGIFRQEPAIAKLDRLFTPTHKSSKCMYTTLVRTSILLSKNFILLRTRSSGFVSAPCDLTHFHTRFRFGFPLRLTLPHRATPWLILQNARYNSQRSRNHHVTERFQVFSPSIKSAFQRSLAVLYLLSDLDVCLGLAVTPAVFRLPIQEALLVWRTA